MASMHEPVQPSAPRITLSVIVPVFNGAETITERVRTLVDYLAACGLSSELIVVNDGSSDDTAGCLARASVAHRGIELIVLTHPRNRGKGAAIATGMRAARGVHRIFIDADLTYAAAEIDRITAALREGADVAVACRVHTESRLLLRPGNLPYAAVRYLIGRVLHWIVGPALRLDLRDTQAGLKGFDGAVADRLFVGWLPRGFSFDLALLFRTRRLGLRIVEVPVGYSSVSEPSTVRIVRDTAAMLRDVARIRFALIEDHFEAWDSAVRSRARRARDRFRRTLIAPAVGPLLACIAALGLFVLLMGRHVWDRMTLAAAGWLVTLIVVLLAAWRADVPFSSRRSRWFHSRRERAVFVLILALCAALRTVHLEDLPPMMHGDSAWCGKLGLMALRGEVHDVFDFSIWYYTPYLSFLPYAASFLVNGVSIFALRAPSALIGTLVMPPLYFLTRAWFGTRPAALAAFLYSVGHASVHFSRIGLWNVQIAFYGVAAFALIVSALHRESNLRMAGAGILSGLALYSYTGGRQIPLVIGLMLALIWLRTRRPPRGIAYYAVALALTIVPLIGNYVRNPAVLATDRTASVWAFSALMRPHVEESLGVQGNVAILYEQISRTLRGFVTLGDASTQYETTQPILSWPSGALAVLGVAAAILGWRQQRFQFLLLWVVLGLLLGSVLIIDPPSYTRFVLVFPAVYILVAVGVEAAFRFARRQIRFGRIEAALACGLVAGQAALFNLPGYYSFTQQVALMSREWDVLKVVERLSNRHDVYLFTGPLLLADSSIFQLFSPDTRTVSGFSASDIPTQLSHDTAFIITPEFRTTGRTLTERFPGIERDVVDVHGVRQLAVYRCTLDNGCRGTS